MKRKGISLPIDMLVVLAIAVIILIAVVAVFMGVWNPFATSQQQRANFNSACEILVNRGCSVDPSTTLCEAAKGVVIDSSVVCASMDDAAKTLIKVGCGCPGVVVTTTASTGAGGLKAAGEECTDPSGVECTSGNCIIAPADPDGTIYPGQCS